MSRVQSSIVPDLTAGDNLCKSNLSTKCVNLVLYILTFGIFYAILNV